MLHNAEEEAWLLSVTITTSHPITTPVTATSSAAPPHFNHYLPDFNASN